MNSTVIQVLCDSLESPSTPLALFTALVISELLPFLDAVKFNGILDCFFKFFKKY